MIYSFTVPGKPRAFLSGARFKRWNDQTLYQDWLKAVRMIARSAGARELTATRDQPLHIHIRTYFADNAHPDPENVRKAIVDALFYKRPGGDKYVGGAHTVPLYDSKNPRTEVVIADGRKRLSETLPEGW